MRFMMTAAAVLLTGFSAPQATDWRTRTVARPSGAVLVGNPDAPVRLAEYLSYTCSHCADFAEDAKGTLSDPMVRSGKVSIEYRPVARNALDVAASVGTLCGGPATFQSLHEAVFAHQAALLARAQALPEPTGTMTERLTALADGSGLTGTLAEAGLPRARYAACLADPAAIQRVLALTAEAQPRIKGTPSFEINGEMVADTHDWGNLAPRLRAAGAPQ